MARGILSSVSGFFFGRSAERPGGRLLAWGVGAFVLTIVFYFTADFWFRGSVHGRGLLILFFGPMLFLFLAIILAPSIFIVGFVTGTPLVSFSAGIAWIRRAWRAILGVLLLFVAAASLLSEILS